MTYPKNKRSMVSAMQFCSNQHVLLTAEVDMTYKLYSAESLELLDVVKAKQKVAAMVYLFLLGSCSRVRH